MARLGFFAFFAAFALFTFAGLRGPEPPPPGDIAVASAVTQLAGEGNAAVPANLIGFHRAMKQANIGQYHRTGEVVRDISVKWDKNAGKADLRPEFKRLLTVFGEERLAVVTSARTADSWVAPGLCLVAAILLGAIWRREHRLAATLRTHAGTHGIESGIARLIEDNQTLKSESADLRDKLLRSALRRRPVPSNDDPPPRGGRRLTSELDDSEAFRSDAPYSRSEPGVRAVRLSDDPVTERAFDPESLFLATTEDLLGRPGTVLVCTIEELDRIHGLYNRPEVFLNKLKWHVLQSLLESGVHADELAARGESVFWWIPPDGDPRQSEEFLLSKYRNSPFKFGDDWVEVPDISIVPLAFGGDEFHRRAV